MQQTALASPPPAADSAVFARVASFRRADVESLDRIEAREIGFDFARRGLVPPEDCGVALREGWLEGRARFGHRTDAGTPWDRKLLRLRLSAWRRNRLVDAGVTPAYLEQISVDICPITREPLTSGTGGLSDATVDRVFNGGAYAVGNLAVMSQRANLAKANRTIDEIIEIADRPAESDELCEGLDQLGWHRLASLCNIALPREVEQHFRPLLVWPPDGLMVSNTIGVLMMQTGLVAMNRFRPAVVSRVREMCGTKAARKAFDEYVGTLRVRIAALSKGPARTTSSVFHPLEDAWMSPLVWQRFVKFVKATPPAGLVGVVHATQDAMGGGFKPINAEQLRGWAIETQGYRRDIVA